MTPTAIAAYLVLFATVGFVFLFATLVLGWFLRAHSPNPAKLDIYECGEPSIGPSSVQFDLRFYVVALVFLIFEVEVAMFYPTATIFGKAIQVLNPSVALSADAAGEPSGQPLSVAAKKYEELGVPASALRSAARDSAVARASEASSKKSGASQETVSQFRWLALASMVDLGLFFAILLVGFAFVWSRGDLDWVRAVRHPPTPAETIALAQRLRSDMAR
jgi:NADH-quinone oxidoreductase subunit A